MKGLQNTKLILWIHCGDQVQNVGNIIIWLGTWLEIYQSSKHL